MIKLYGIPVSRGSGCLWMPAGLPGSPKVNGRGDGLQKSGDMVYT